MYWPSDEAYLEDEAIWAAAEEARYCRMAADQYYAEQYRLYCEDMEAEHIENLLIIGATEK